MNYFESVQLLLCDLATKVYNKWICMTFLCEFDKCEVYVVVSDNYWSSSSNVNNSNNAWNVNFNNCRLIKHSLKSRAIKDYLSVISQASFLQMCTCIDLIILLSVN